jgi:hypothetical protein
MRRPRLCRRGGSCESSARRAPRPRRHRIDDRDVGEQHAVRHRQQRVAAVVPVVASAAASPRLLTPQLKLPQQRLYGRCYPCEASATAPNLVEAIHPGALYERRSGTSSCACGDLHRRAAGGACRNSIRLPCSPAGPTCRGAIATRRRSSLRQAQLWRDWQRVEERRRRPARDAPQVCERALAHERVRVAQSCNLLTSKFPRFRHNPAPSVILEDMLIWCPSATEPAHTTVRSLRLNRLKLAAHAAAAVSSSAPLPNVHLARTRSPTPVASASLSRVRQIP